MTKSVEFCFDVVSPASYIAWHVLPRIAEKAGAEILYRPIFLGGLMEAAGNRSPISCPNKGTWMGGDLKRWADLYGLEFRLNDKFPQMTLHHMRGAIALQNDPLFGPLRHPPLSGHACREPRDRGPGHHRHAADRDRDRSGGLPCPDWRDQRDQGPVEGEH